MMAIGAGALKAGTGIMGAISGNQQATAEARARNEAMMAQYKHQLQIRDKRYKDSQQIYASKLGQYDLTMKAADRAASRAYGEEQYRQSQRLKTASFAQQRLNMAMARSGGAAAASGKSGRSAQSLDANVEKAYVRNQATLAANLLAGSEASSMKMLGIQDQLQSARNRAYGQIAIAPTEPLMPLAPTQVDGPNQTGMYLQMGNAVLQGVQTAMSGFAPPTGA